MPPIATVIQRLREERDWTQAQLAKRSGLRQEVISRYESGAVKTARGPARKALAKAFGLQLGDFDELCRVTTAAPKRSMDGRYDQFQAFRTRLNERILGAGKPEGEGGGSTIVTKRFFALDDQTYRDTSAEGGLDKKTKELLGLTASAVLRCDDCIAYHIDQCVQAGCSDKQIWEALDVALIVGGSIVIPHLRRGVEFLDECRSPG